jgi:hypothetical protein
MRSIIFAIAFYFSANIQAQTAKEIVQKADEKMRGTTSQVELTITLPSSMISQSWMGTDSKKWNLSVTPAKEITPLLSVNASLLYAPGTNLFIFFPSFQYNLATNLDISLVWQSFFAELNKTFEAVNHRGFLRMKWSF